MRFDLFIILVGILLLVAMALTLLYGREHSRHGYGRAPLQPSSPQQAHTVAGSKGALAAQLAALSGPSTQDRVAALRPGVDPSVQVIQFREPPPRQVVDDLGTA